MPKPAPPTTRATAQQRATAREQKARERVNRAAYARAAAQGEAQYLFGYRAGRLAALKTADDEYERVRQKEMMQWQNVGRCEQNLTRALAAYRRAIRESGR